MREEREFAISGKQKVSVREETNAVSSTTVMSMQNRFHLSVEVQQKHSTPVQKFSDGEQFGAQMIEDSPALCLRPTAKFALSNTFLRMSIPFAFPQR